MNRLNGRWVRAVLVGVAAVAWWRDLSQGRGFGFAVITTGLCLLAGLLWRGWERRAALQAVRTQPIPSFLRTRLRGVYPHLDDAATLQVERGLRQFFGANARARGAFVAMPSKVVDALWHEFILHTRSYEVFCQRAFGRTLHHTPAEALDGPAPSDRPARAPRGGSSAGERLEGLRRAWNWSCHEEGIDPRRPAALPLLFALDTLLAIPDGYRYVPDCRLLGEDRGNTHCGSDLGGGSSGDASGSDGGSDGGGDGGGGDGGGGCGGGGD